MEKHYVHRVILDGDNFSFCLKCGLMLTEKICEQKCPPWKTSTDGEITETKRVYETRSSSLNVSKVASAGNIENAVAVSRLLAQLIRALSESDKKSMAKIGFGLKDRQKLYHLIRKFNEAHSLIPKT